MEPRLLLLAAADSQSSFNHPINTKEAKRDSRLAFGIHNLFST